jgi:putative MATE family efflux protein
MARSAERNLTEGSIPRHVLALALPSVLFTVVHNLYGLNDIFFSKYLGKTSQTAVSNNLFTLIALFGFIQLASIGTLTLVSRRTGSGNEEGADRAARQGMIFGLVLSLAVAVIGFLTLPWIPRLMGMAEDVTRESTIYLGIVFAGLPAMFLPPVVDVIFRARGDTMTPLLMQIVSVGTNIAGNAAAVFWLDTGIAGIAISTIVSRLVSAVLGIWILKRGRVGIRLTRRSGPLLDVELWLKIAKVAAPIGLRTLLFGVIYQLVTRVASGFGTGVQNGLGVGIRMEGFGFFVLMGFAMAAAPIVGQNLGAGKPDRAMRGAWITVAMACVPALLFTALFAFGPRTLMAAFASDPETLDWGASYLRVVSVCMVFTALDVCLAQSFMGAGDTIPPSLVDIPLTVARVPVAWLLAHHLEMGPTGIWITIAGSAILKGIALAALFARGRWKRARPDLD